MASDMNDKSYPSSMESNCVSGAAAATATRGGGDDGGGGGAAVHLCANIYVTALLAPTFDIGP